LAKLSSEFRKALNGVDTAIKTGTARALNRALSTAKSQMVKKLREDTGLKTDVINTRTLAVKANVNHLSAILKIAVKFGIALSKFGPSARKVIAKYSDGTKRARQGVTAKIGKQARQLVPGAFLLDNKRGLAVVGRKAAYDENGQYVDSKTQGKLVNLKTTIFTEAAVRNQAEVQKVMNQAFIDRVDHEIDYAIQQKLDSNR
jgi:hypothetical protein